MKNKPNTRIADYTFQELPLRELFCGVLMGTSLFAGTAATIDADTSDVQVAYPASQFGVFDEDVTLTAAGGDASADGSIGGPYEATAWADAEAVGIDGELLPDVSSVADFSGTVDLSAIGGSAFAAASGYAHSAAAGYVSAVGYIEGDFSGAIQGVATGGLAESFMASESTSAFANALAVGIDGLSGDSTGSIAVTATGGTANAGYELLDFMIPDDVEAVALSISEEGIANASAIAIASNGDRHLVFDSIEGDPIEESQLITGSYSATAAGGEATANGFSFADADASAFAAANVINDDFEGEIDAEFIASATGGTATATAADAYFAVADASAEANGLSDLLSIDGSLAGTMDAQATGGAATVSSDFGDSFADAGARAVGLQFNYDDFDLDDELEGDAYYFGEHVIFGDVSADITAIATGGEAGHSNEGYMMYPNDEIDGDDLDYVDYGALSDAYAAGIDSVSEIYGDVTGGINVSAFGGEAVSFTLQSMYSDELEADQFGGGVYANASAEAVGISGLDDSFYYDAIEGDFYEESSLSIFGEVSSDITAVAVGGNALVGGSFDSSSAVYASAVATGIDGDVIAESMLILTDSIESEESGPLATALSGSFDVSAFGGGAYSVPGFGSEIYYMNEYDVIESIVIYSDQYANASGTASAVDGEVFGNVDADFTVNAVGGFAYEQGFLGNGPSSDYNLYADADAVGISGRVWGSFTGDMQVSATGGTAMLQSSYYYGDLDAIEGDSFLLEDVSADASAIATGIGSGDEAIYGDLSGTISVTATGGTVAIINDDFYGAPDALEGDYTSGVYLPEAAFSAHAQAIALNGAVYSEEISGDLTATAVGGLLLSQGVFPSYGDSIESVQMAAPDSVDAFAAGIVGDYIETIITGTITAIATPGVYGYSESYYPSDALEGDVIPGIDLSQTPEIPEPDYTEAAGGYAIGIMGASSNYSQLPADIEGIPSGSSVQALISNSVHAIVLQPELLNEGFDDDIESGEAISQAYNNTYNAYAAAVYGGSDDDYILLDEGASIIGDINLNGGENELYVIGDTLMQGDILSSSDERVEYGLGIYNGSGTVDFDIEAGMFTAVGTVNVSDLEDQIDIASGAGLAPLISRDSEFSSLINVFGDEADVVFAEGSIVRPTFNGMEDWSDVLASEDEDDKKFLIVSSTASIDTDNAILDASRSPFEVTFLKEDGTILLPNDLEALIEEGNGENLYLALGDVVTPTGDETPGASQTVQAANVSSQAVMIDISKRASLMRSMLRGTVAYSGEAPAGAAGPDAERMQNGEWLSYISAFGNIGKQDNVNGAVGFDYDTYGFVIGQEKLLGDAMIIGIAGSYAQTDVEGNNGFSGGDTDLYSGAVYANWFTDTWYTEAGLTYGHAETETRRKDVSNISYTGDYDSNLYGTWVEVGYTTTYEGLEAEPYARASYVYGDHEGFTDSGVGPNPLTTKDTDTQNFQTEIGIRITEEWVFEDDSRFFLGVKAAWEHEWADQNVRLDAEYLGAEINIESAEADRAALVLGVRGEWRSANGLSLGLKYEPSIAGNWMNHAFSGTLQYNW